MNDTMNTPLPPDDDSPALDPVLLDAFAEAQAADANKVSAGVAAKIKRRLLGRIAESATPTHLTVQAADNTWQPFLPGVRIKVLNEADGIMSYLLQLAPGAQFASHRHPINEECVVLEGTLQIGTDLLVPAGGFHMALRDTVHATVSTVTGATIYLRGASPHPADLV
jgi:quercetin dioxygenase-like cupin family protein